MKKKLINNFLTLIKEIAVDCELLKNVNMIEDKYECFKFEEPKLFEKKIGPAFKEDIFLDKNLDNGLNNSNSMIKKIKVKKIFGVKLLSSGAYSDKQIYWLNPESYVIYDYELHFAIGLKSRIK